MLFCNDFICLLGLLLSWERIHYFLCLQDVLHVWRQEVVSHCLKGDTTSNRIGVKAVELSTWTARLCFQVMTGAWFSSLLLFDNIASSGGACRALWGACAGMEAAGRGKKGFWNSSSKNKKNMGVRRSGERMLCSCAIYHFFRLFWLFSSVSASAFV